MELLDKSSGQQKTSEQAIREQLRDTFDDNVKFVFEDCTSRDPLLDGLRVEAAIATVYQTLKGEPVLSHLCSFQGIDYNKILDEECTKALKRYLEGIE